MILTAFETISFVAEPIKGRHRLLCEHVKTAAKVGECKKSRHKITS